MRLGNPPIEHHGDSSWRGATAFGDGIEADALALASGQTLTVGVSAQALRLVR